MALMKPVHSSTRIENDILQNFAIYDSNTAEVNVCSSQVLTHSSSSVQVRVLDGRHPTALDSKCKDAYDDILTTEYFNSSKEFIKLKSDSDFNAFNISSPLHPPFTGCGWYRF